MKNDLSFRWIAFPGAIAILASGLARAASLPAPDPSTKYVETYTPPESAYIITRRGGSVQLRYGLPLQNGDSISLIDPKTDKRMTLMIDGSEVSVDVEHPSYTVVSGPAPLLAAIEEAKTFIADLPILKRAQHDYDAERTTETKTRGGTDVPPPSLPLLRGNLGRIVEGTRALAVAWRNGTAPFRVRLSREGTASTPARERSNVRESHLRFEPIAFARGTYRLEVTDASDNTATASFAAVSETSLPTLPPDEAAALSDSSQPAGFRAGIYAAWLLQQDPAWRLEAYQRVAEHTADSDLARLVSFELTGG